MPGTKIEPKKPLWKAEIPGRGAGSPTVVGGKVFLQTASADGKTRTLLCFSASDGKPLWAENVPGTIAKTHAKNTLASGTPAADADGVYCVWWDGAGVSLYAYDTGGKEKWRASLGGYVSQHGPGMSPVLYEGLVYVNVDDDERAELVAFDAKTGQKKWGAPRKHHKACYSSPFVLERNGKTELVLGTTTSVTSYDPATGKVNWNYDLEWPKGVTVLRAVGQPVYAGGVVVVFCGEGGNSRYAVAVKPGEPGSEGRAVKAWETRKQVPYVPSLLARDKLLFWLHDDGRAGCTEAKTGKVLWEESLFSGAVTASPVAAGDEILAISEKGQIAVLKADAEFDLVSKVELGEGVYATPALADGRVFIRGTAHLFCFGKK
ncbi:Pyrrolo-quinoline quinone OS=Pedosphaera parvula (strain Ellin514) GN=Cflav_PD1224 PE=4 SV=1: PQQ_2: PQQ_2 [Gemmata massiliana]|uniref:Pyrrolo-quinoline quinone repeat domain-containing protein n=1 Tax=Gemmata massiliana TaxID=1210884 RepID=A0A6P2DFN5_9BACT|nr:PQQ-binding-like beta-propeller repeat protein [Gemmata massiliana]VTR98494.1 Pyrrolo-quinoline quinone OS=Pedosphaera parvula (strain Ellin514) GN=Cflav_PD1224 PE=4 SV=1: PQQ_2: PQQ_2 [Gemmata massiliana]